MHDMHFIVKKIIHDVHNTVNITANHDGDIGVMCIKMRDA